MNLCIFEGNLTRDPELRTVPTKNGDVSVVSFSIALNDTRGNGEKVAYYPNFEAWAQGADTIQKWFKKGDLIRVYCRLIQETWVDKASGENRRRDKYRVDRFDFPPINKGRDRTTEDENTEKEAPDAGEPKPEAPETPVTPAPEPRKSRATPTRKPRQPVTVPADNDDDDDEDIPF